MLSLKLWLLPSRLKQALQGSIHPGDTDENRSTATLFQHLQGNGPGPGNSGGFRGVGQA